MKAFNGKRATLLRSMYPLLRMRAFEHEAGLNHMAFAFKQEVSTGKGGKPLFPSSHALVIQTKT